MSSWLQEVCTVKVGDLVASKREVVAVDANTLVSDVIEILKRENLVSIGVYGTPGSWIGSGGVNVIAHGRQYIGVVSILDLMAFVLNGNVSKQLGSRVAEAIGSTNESLSLWVEPTDRPLYFAMEQFCKGVHRALVFDSSCDTGSVKFLSQTDVVKYLMHADFAVLPHLQNTLDMPVVNIATPQPNCISCDTSLTSALNLLLKHYAMPVIDSEGRAISTFSASDLRGLQSTSSAFTTEQTVEQFLREKFGGNLNPALLVPTNTSVREAASIMLQNGVHRLWVAPSAEGPIVGVVSYTDIIRAIYTAEKA